MNDSLVTVRYAKALHQLAIEEGKQDIIKKDVTGILATITKSTEFSDFLESPLIKTGKKSEVIKSMFKGNINELTYRFLELLIKNKREGLLKFICLYYFKLHKEEQGIQEALLTTSVPLSENYKKSIHNYISQKFKVKIELEDKVDPSIIGGFVLRIEDKQVNASLRAQLNKIKQELINS
ncbi:MAG: ATP synthase F1 subunit delta [Bacteroidales bacterium]|nr:ATP synthase F1 subunit delta [Bacteroidales bacterium]